MNRFDAFDRTLSDWLHADDVPEPARRVYEAAFAQARGTRRARPIPAAIARWFPMSTTFDTPVMTLRSRWMMLVVTALVTLALVGAAVFATGSPRPTGLPLAWEAAFEPIESLPGTLQSGEVVTSAVNLADGSVLVVTQHRLIRFDPATNSFAAAGDLGFPRMFASTVRLDDGRVLIVGGTGGHQAELYDLATGAVARTGDTVETRAESAATILHDGTVLITGGGGQRGTLASAELYDPTTGSFVATGSMSRPRSSHSSILLADGRVLVVGGGGADLDVSAELYDPATRTFSPTGPMAFPHSHFTATSLLDGRVLLAGGITGGSNPEQSRATGAAQVYDPVTGRFSRVGSLPRPRTYHAAATLEDGRVLVVGGVLEPRSRSNVTADAQLFDPATGQFRPAGTMTEARFNFHAVPLADGRVLILGHHWLNPLPATIERPRSSSLDPFVEEDRIGRSAEVYQPPER